MIEGEGTAENKLMVLGYRPRTAIGGFGIENAGIKRVRVRFGEPLLNGKILPQLFFRAEGSSDNGICTIRTDEILCLDGVRFLCFQILIGNEKAAVAPLQPCANGIAVQLYRLRQKGFQPKIEFMAVHIDVEPLIMANQLTFQINGFYGENLRIDQNILRQG